MHELHVIRMSGGMNTVILALMPPLIAIISRMRREIVTCLARFLSKIHTACSLDPVSRHPQRLQQARRIRLACAGDVKRCAVIGAGAHQRQAQRHIHPTLHT